MHEHPGTRNFGPAGLVRESHILHGVDMRVGQGEVVTLLGRNGAGRTTTLRAILGLTGSRKGSVRIHGTEAIDLPTYKIAHLGVGYCPRNAASSQACPARKTCCCPGGRFARRRHVADRDLRHVPQPAGTQAFPGTRLSGGEQQMLAVARILRTGANLLLLDEISEGLAPVIVQALARMITALKQRGYTIVMVEQNFRFAAPLADRFYVMEHGQIVEHFEAAELAEKQDTLNELLGV